MVSELVHTDVHRRTRSASDTSLEMAAYFDALDRQYNDPKFDNDELVKHDPSNETMPHLPQYHPSFSEAERTVTMIVQNLHQHI